MASDPQTESDEPTDEVSEASASEEEASEEEASEEEARPILARDQKLAMPIGILVIGIVLALGATQVSNADLGFHLATGHYILDSGSIPATNVLSFTEPNHPWLLHEWLSSVFITKVWDLGGAGGLFIAKLLLLGLTWMLVFSNTRRWGASVPAAGLATVLCSWAAASRFIMRPQLFSNLALAGGLWLISRWLQDPESPDARRRLIGTGIVLTIAYQWHAGAISLVIALGIIAVAIALEPVGSVFGRAVEVAARGKRLALNPALVVAGAMGITVALLAIYHPHGPKVLLVPFQLGLDDTLRDHVIEYRPAWAFPMSLTFPFWIVLGLTLASAIALFRKFPFALLLPPLLFAILALRHQRMVDSFAVVAAPLIAVGFSRLTARWSEAEPLLLLTLIGAAIGAPLQHWRYYPIGPGLNPAVWPSKVFAWVKAEKLSGPTFISDGWAGPFLAEFFPEQKSFFDPRFEAYSPQHYLGVYRRIRYGQPGWDKLLDDFGVQLIILKYTSAGEAKRQKDEPNVRQHLLVHPDWSLIGFDERGEIFVRKSGPNGEKANRYGVSCFDPDRAVFIAPPNTCARSLLAMIERGFTANHVLLPAAIAQAHIGQLDTAQHLVNEAKKQWPGDDRVPRINQELRLIAQAASKAREPKPTSAPGSSAAPAKPAAPPASAKP